MKSLLQSQFWAKFKASQGWRPHRLQTRVLILERSFGRFPILYAPELTPEVLPLRRREITSLVRAARSRSPRAVLLRLEWLCPKDEVMEAVLNKLSFRKGAEVQPEIRQLIDLRPPLEEIVRQMKPKTRYNLQLARQRQLSVRWGRAAELSTFVRLYHTAAHRGRFAPRGAAYFQSLLEYLPMVEIVSISHGRRPIAAALVSFYDGVASYLYGGLDYAARALMAPYLLHYSVIERAKKQRCTSYDLLAVGPRYPGLTRFKAGFGGTTVEYLGSYDYPLRPALYRLFRLIEYIRRGP